MKPSISKLFLFPKGLKGPWYDLTIYYKANLIKIDRINPLSHLQDKQTFEYELDLKEDIDDIADLFLFLIQEKNNAIETIKQMIE